MVQSTKTVKSKIVKTKKPVQVDWKELPTDLLSPEEYSAMTAANYHHPESRLILQLFLHVNYLWQLSRHMQNKPSSIPVVDWQTIEINAGMCIRSTCNKLLGGVEVSPWAGSIEPEKKRS
jgi:hypothetical protein